MTETTRYQRILLKLSGEALLGKLEYGVDPAVVAFVAEQVKAVTALGVQVGIVVGGGNIFRGMAAATATVTVIIFVMGFSPKATLERECGIAAPGLGSSCADDHRHNSKQLCLLQLVCCDAAYLYITSSTVNGYSIRPIDLSSLAVLQPHGSPRLKNIY